MTTPMSNRLPFRFADGGATPIEPPLADPQQQSPGILVGPDDPSLGEYGRGWQLKQVEINLSDERRAGWPNRAGLRQTVANSWRDEGDRIPPAAPHLAMALSNLVSMEGEAYYPVQDWLADLKERHKEEQDRHYQLAARHESQGHRREAAYHHQAAEDWQQASGVEEEIYGSALQREGWQVITPKSAKGGNFHFSGGRFRELAGSENDLGEKIGGRFTPFLGLHTQELPELDRLMREKYGSRAYLVEYKDIRGGIDTSHPFAVVDGQLYGAYDPQELDTPKPLTTVYIPPENWSPPNYEVNHDLIRERREREQRIAAAGRPATPAEVTTEVADLYQQIDTGTDYTETQAQEIQEALQEARSAAAEAHAAAERATTLASLARKLASGAATDVRSSRLAAEKVLPNAEEDLPAPDSGDLETLERDAEALRDVSEAIPGDYDPESYPTSGESVYDDAEGPMYGPESPFTAADDLDGSVGPMEHGAAEYAEMEDEVLHPIAGPDPESDYTNDATSEPLAKQTEDLLIGRHMASLNPADKARHPALIIRKAIIKAEKAEVIADEAVEASREAAAASGRMTAAFARLRQLARAANVKADSLPDHADDAAQRYADMSDAEIAEAMPIVQRTNQRVLMARDMALYAAEQSGLAVKVASSNESWLHSRFEKLGIEHRLEDTAFAHAELAELTWVDVPEEHREMFEDHLERRVEQRREDKKPPDYLAEGATGETLTPHFAPTTVVIPENQPLEKEKISGRNVEGYRLDGVFYLLDDLNPVMDPNTGRQEVKAPPDWVEPESPDDVQRLVFEQRLKNVPQVDPNAVIPPPPEDSPGDGPAGPKVMRDYQEAILAEMDDELGEVDSLLVTAPTGAGKTILFSEYIRRAREEDKTVAVVTHREELLKQATGAIEAQTGETPGIVWREQQEWNQPITVISHGSLVQDNRKPPADFKADIVIFDEAHHAAAEGWQSIREKLNPDILLGFTATPFRDDEKPLTPEPFARVIRPVTPADLIKRGALVPAKVERVTLTNDKGEVVPIGKANNLPTLYAEGVAYALGQGRRKVIVYVSQSRGASPTKIVRDTKTELDRLGINAGMVVSTGTTREEREQALEEFSKAPRAVLVNYQTLVEGYNEPATDAVIIGRNSSSEGDLVQMVGRGLRTSPGKTNCLVLDYSGRDDLNDIINYWRVDKEREEPAKRTKQPGNPPGETTAPRVARKAAPDRPELAVSEKRPGKLAAEVEITPKPTYGKSNEKLKVAEKAPLSLAPADLDDLDRETVVVQGRRRGRRRRDEEVDNRPPVLNVTFG